MTADVHQSQALEFRNMLHHLSLGVSTLAVSGAFYDAALGALGFVRVFEDATAIGYGLLPGEDKLCLKQRPAGERWKPTSHTCAEARPRGATLVHGWELRRGSAAEPWSWSWSWS